MLDDLLNQVKKAIYDDPSTPHQEGNDPSGLIGNIEGLFAALGAGQQGTTGLGGALGGLAGGALGGGALGQILGQVMQGGRGPDPASGGFDNVRPASEDPLGDPADGQFPGIKPASEDPLGDPADLASQFPGLKPASEDPLGDPADQ